MDAARDLWMFWTDVTTDTGMRREFRFAELPLCPAAHAHPGHREREVCVLFDRQLPPAHSWGM
ncbi:putative protein OS=Streptomyces microflavus OX=1919 GN=Smic_48260 PE=4 SV=1 [Streptomyces microflavus]